MYVYRFFLLDAGCHTFMARSLTYPRNKGQMYEKFKTKVSRVTFILVILFISAFEQAEAKGLTNLQLWSTLAISGVLSHIKADIL